VHVRAGRHICEVVSDKGVWLPCQLLKGLGHAGALLLGGEKAVGALHMGADASAVVVVVRVWLRLEWRLCTLVDQARGSEEWSALSLPRETPALPCDDH